MKDIDRSMAEIQETREVRAGRKFGTLPNGSSEASDRIALGMLSDVKKLLIVKQEEFAAEAGQAGARVFKALTEQVK